MTQSILQVLQVRCPRCGATPGRNCVTPMGYKTKVHQIRVGHSIRQGILDSLRENPVKDVGDKR